MLEQLTALLAASGGWAAILVLLTLGPLLTRKVSPHWRYWAWAVVAVSLMAYPILGPVLGALFPAPIQLDVPQMVAHGAYDRYNAYHLDNQPDRGGRTRGSRRDKYLRGRENQCGTVITSTIQTGRAGR